MAKVKIKSNHDYYKGRTIKFHQSEIVFDNEGVAEVEADHAEELKKSYSHISDHTDAVAKTPKKEPKKPEGGKETEFEDEGKSEGAGANENEVEEDEISKLPDEDLKELALSVEGATKKSVNKMSRDEMIAYIKENMPS